MPADTKTSESIKASQNNKEMKISVFFLIISFTGMISRAQDSRHIFFPDIRDSICIQWGNNKFSTVENQEAPTYLHITDSIIYRNNSMRNGNKVWLTYQSAKISERLKRTNQAITLYDSAYKQCIDREYKVYILYQKISMLINAKQTIAAINNFKKLLPFLADTGLSEQKRAQIYIAGSRVHYSRKEYEQATHYLLLARQHIYSADNDDRKALLHQLAHIYSETGNYKNAFDLHIAFHQSEDSIKSKKILEQVNELETRYRVAAKDRVIAEERLKYHTAEQKYYREQVWISTGIIILSLLLLLLGIRYYYVKQKKDKLEAEQKINYLQGLMAGEEKERNRMARELHDGVNSTLAATHSYLHTFEQLHPKVASDRYFLKVKQILLSTSNEIRAIAHNLTPNVLIKDGLTHALQEFCKTLFLTSALIEIQSYGQEYIHNEKDKLFLYRIAQELLYIINKCTNATEIIIIIGFEKTGISLTIEDNGTDITTADGKNANSRLAALKEKSVSGKGRINIEVQPGKGRMVHIVFPVHNFAIH